jgi:PQQ-like domain/Carboxypeptidase regulatory-like domain/von Willebrand factor type D domain
MYNNNFVKQFFALNILIVSVFTSCASQPETPLVAGTQPTTIYFVLPNVDKGVERLEMQVLPTATVTAKMATGSRPKPMTLTTTPQAVLQRMQGEEVLPVVSFRDVVPGTYHATLRGLDRNGVTLYSAEEHLQVRAAVNGTGLLSLTNTPNLTTMTLERATGTVVVNAPVPTDAMSLSFTARIAEVRTRLQLRGATLTGILADVATGTSVPLIVEGRDDTDTLRYQGTSVISITDSSTNQTMTLTHVLAGSTMPSVTAFSTEDKIGLREDLKLRLEGRSNDGQSIGKLLVTWGDGTSTQQPLPESVTLLEPAHAYSSAGIRVVTACLVHTSGLASCVYRFVNVVDPNASPRLGKNGLLQLRLTEAPIYASSITVKLQPLQNNVGRDAGTVPARVVVLQRESLQQWSGVIQLRRGVQYAVTTDMEMNAVVVPQAARETDKIVLSNQVTSLELKGNQFKTDLTKLPDSRELLPGFSDLHTATISYRIDPFAFSNAGKLVTESTELPLPATVGEVNATISESTPRFVILENAKAEMIGMDYISPLKPFVAFNHRNTAIALVLSQLNTSVPLSKLNQATLIAVMNHPDLTRVEGFLSSANTAYPDEATRELVRLIAEVAKPFSEPTRNLPATPGPSSALTTALMTQMGFPIRTSPKARESFALKLPRTAPSGRGINQERVARGFPGQAFLFIPQAVLKETSRDEYELNSTTAFGFGVYEKYKKDSQYSKRFDVGTSNNIIGINTIDLFINYFISRQEFKHRVIPEKFCDDLEMSINLFLDPNTKEFTDGGWYNLFIAVDEIASLVGDLIGIPIQRNNGVVPVKLKRADSAQKIAKLFTSIGVYIQTTKNFPRTFKLDTEQERMQAVAAFSDLYKSAFGVWTDLMGVIGDKTFDVTNLAEKFLNKGFETVLKNRFLSMSNPAGWILMVERILSSVRTIWDGISSLVNEIGGTPISAIIKRDPILDAKFEKLKFEIPAGETRTGKVKVINKGCGLMKYRANNIYRSGDQSAVAIEIEAAGTVQGTDEGPAMPVAEDKEFKVTCQPDAPPGTVVEGILSFLPDGFKNPEDTGLPPFVSYEVKCKEPTFQPARFSANVEITSPLQVIAEADPASSDIKCNTAPVTMAMSYIVPEGFEVESEDGFVTASGAFTFLKGENGSRISNKLEARLSPGVYRATISVTFKNVSKKLEKSWSFNVKAIDKCAKKPPPCTICGDPHIVTPDGLVFDSHAYGEFWYLRPKPGSDPNGLVLQGRQEGINTQFAPAIMTALAARVDGRVVEFSRNRGVWVDGVRQTGDAFLQLAPKVTLSIQGGQSVLSWGNGSLRYAATSMFLTVAQDDTLYGLLGSPNGNSSDDYRLPNGFSPVDNLKLGFGLSEGWRITNKNDSLFTYEAGQGPETFNKPNNRGLPTLEEIARVRVDVDRLFQNACGDGAIPTATADGIALDTLLGLDESNSLIQMCAYEVKGQLSNSTLPGVALAGARVRVSSPVFQPCETFTDAQGNYRCRSFPSANAGQVTGQSSLTIEVDGVAPIVVALPGKAGKGETLSLTRDIAAPLTTLQVTGVLLDEAGSPVPDALVRLEGADQKRTAMTDATGQYSFLLPFSRTLSTDFSMTLISERPGARAERTFGTRLVVDGLKEQTENLRFARSVKFSGTLQLKGAGLLDGVVVLRAANGSELCRTTTTGGQYSCDVKPPATGDFTVAYSASGAWGSTVEAVVVTVPSAAQVFVNEVTVPLGVVTTLRVTGRVLRLNDSPAVNATVSLSGDALIGPGSAQTNAEGRFDTILLLKPGTTSGVVNLFADVVGLRTVGVVSFAGAARGEGIEISANDLRLSRVVTFAGTLRTAGTNGNLPLGGTVTVKLGAVPLCTVGTSSAVFSCQVQFGGTEAFDVALTATGDWGTATTVLAVPEGGEPVTVRGELIADNVNLLRVTGTVRNTLGVPMPAVSVEALDNPAFSGSAVRSTTSAADGLYELLIPLKTAVTTGSVTARASLNEQAGESNPLPFTVAQNTAQIAGADVVLSNAVLPARLLLSGLIEDVTGQPVAGASVSASGSSLLRGGSGLTDATGAYSFEVVVRPTVTSGTLLVNTSGAQGRGSSNVPFSGAVAGESIPVNVPTLRFSRSVTFIGTVRNVTVPSLQVNTRIAIYVGQTLLCDTGVSWTVVENNAVGRYSCAAQMFNAEAFNASINAVGSWGTSNASVGVPVPTPGTGNTDVMQDLPLAPTVLRLAGTVLDTSAAPSVNASVRVTSSGLEGGSLEIMSDARGQYSAYAFVAAGVSSLDLGFVVRDAGNNVSSRSFTLAVTPNALTERSEDFTLQNRLPGQARWTGSIAATTVPAVAPSGTLYIADGSGGLKAFEADGAPRWTFQRGSTASAVAESGTIYVGGDRLYAVNPDGTERWNYGFGANVSAPAVSADGTVYVTSESALHALTSSGGVAWSAPLEGASTRGAPAMAGDGHLYVVVGNKNLQRVSNTGVLEWQQNFSANIASPAIGADGMVYVTRSDGAISAINSDGTQKWTYQSTSGGSLNPPVVSGDRIYAPLGTKLVVLGFDGTERWVYSTSAAAATPVIADDGKIYDVFGSELHALNPDGSKRWVYAGNAALGTPSIGVDGSVYVSSGSGLFAVNSDSNGLASGWAKFGGDIRNRNQATSDGIARRTLKFKGVITLPPIVLAPHMVRVTDPSGALLCRTTVSSNGQYSCGSQTATLTAMRAIVTATGDLRTATGSLDLTAGSGSLESALDLAMPYTALKLSGIARRADGSLGADVRVLVTGVSNGVPLESTATTDAEGRYRLTMLLTDVNATFNLRVRTGSDTTPVFAERELSVTVQAGQTFERILDITPTSVQLSGTVRQPNGSSAAGAEVQVSGDFSGSTLTDSNGQYRFAFALTGTVQSVSLQLRATKDGVTLARTVQQPIVPDALNQRSVDFNLGSPTIMRFTGKIARADGTLASNANVTLTAQTTTGTTKTTTVTTNPGGQYDGSLYFLDNPTSAYYTIKVLDAFHTTGWSTSQALTVRETTEVTKDFTIDNTSMGQVTSGLSGIKDRVATSDRIYTVATDAIIATANNGTELWRQSITVKSELSVSSDGYVYGVDTTNALFKLTRDGAVSWRFPLTGSCVICSQAPAIAANGTVYLALDRALVAINPDGTQKWSTALAGTAVAEPIIDADGNVYVKQTVSGNDVLTSFDPAGVLRWSQQGVGSSYSKTIILTRDGRIVVALGNALYSFLPDRTKVWKLEQNTVFLVADAAGFVYAIKNTPRIPGYYGSRDSGSLVKIDSSGSAVWDRVFVWDNYSYTGELILGDDERIYLMDRVDGFTGYLPNGSEFLQLAANTSGNLGAMRGVVDIDSSQRLGVRYENGLGFVKIPSSGLGDGWARRGRDGRRSGTSPVVAATRRWVTVSGSLQNLTLPDRKLTGYWVKVTVGETQRCDAQVDTNAAYTCRLEASVADGFDAVIEARSSSSATLTALAVTQAVPSAALGTAIGVERNLELSPTALQVAGTIRDSAGLPFGNRSVTLAVTRNNTNIRSQQLTTNAQGGYMFADLLDPETYTATLYLTDASGNAYSKTLPEFSVAANALTNKVFDFRFDPDSELTVSGVVRNHLNEPVVSTSVSLYVGNISASATTNANGQYTFTKRIKPGQYSIYVSGRDRATNYKSVNLQNLDIVPDTTVTKTLDLTYDPVGELVVSGSVKKADGTGAVSRQVYISGLPYRSPGNYAVTGANGTFEYRQWLAVGNYDVYATTSDPYSFPAQSATQRITTNPTTTPTEVTLELQDPQTAQLALNGLITDASGYAYINRSVGIEVWNGSRRYTQSAQTDGIGSYETTLRVLEGTYAARIKVFDSNGLENYAQLEAVTLSPLAPTSRMLDLALRRTGQIIVNGTLLNAQGSPVQQSYYPKVEFTDGAFSRTVGFSSDATGRFTVATQTLPAGIYRVKVFAIDNTFNTYQTVALDGVVVTAGATTTQVLDLNYRRVTIGGTLRDAENRVVAGATVTVANSGTLRCAPCEVTTDAQGVYSLALQPDPNATTLTLEFSVVKGAYIQRFNTPLTLTQNVVSEIRDLKLDTAGTRVEIGGTVKNTAGGLLTGVRITVVNAGSGVCQTCTATTNAEGRYSVLIRLGIGETTAYYRLQATLENETSEYDFSESGLVTANANVIQHDLSLNAGVVEVTVRGRIFDSSGVVLSGVNLTLKPPTDGSCNPCSTTSIANGKYELRFGIPLGSSSTNFEVIGSYLNANRTMTFAETVPSDVRAFTATHDFVMGKQLEISGLIRDASGNLLTATPVSLGNTGAAVCRICDTTTDTNGYYRLELVVPINTNIAQLDLTVDGADGAQEFSISPDDLSDNQSNSRTYDLDYAPVIIAKISGRIIGSDGLPLVGISLNPNITSGSNGYGGLWTTDSDGRYYIEVKHTHSESSLTGTVSIILPSSRPEFAFSYPIDPNSQNEFTKDITVDFAQSNLRTLTVRGTVSDRLGSPIAGASVYQDGYLSSVADAQGRFEIPVKASLEAGVLVYKLRAVTKQWEYSQVYTLNDPSSGSNEVAHDLTLDTTRVTLTISGTVSNAVGQAVVGATVGFTYRNAPVIGSETSVTDASGRYELRLSVYEGSDAAWYLQVTLGNFVGSPDWNYVTIGSRAPYVYLKDLVIQP